MRKKKPRADFVENHFMEGMIPITFHAGKKIKTSPLKQRNI
ncbi:MAG: hypothetical protein RL346_1300 [Verrucomicrobiota bacterium]